MSFARSVFLCLCKQVSKKLSFASVSSFRFFSITLAYRHRRQQKSALVHTRQSVTQVFNGSLFHLAACWQLRLCLESIFFHGFFLKLKDRKKIYLKKWKAIFKKILVNFGVYWYLKKTHSRHFFMEWEKKSKPISTCTRLLGLRVSCMDLVRVLIDSLNRLCSLWLARVITLGFFYDIQLKIVLLLMFSVK